MGIAKRLGLLVLGAGIALGLPVAADDWDQGADADNGIGTDNALFHGSEQTHDLGVRPGQIADEDWYLTSSRPVSSYSFMVEAFTGDLDLTPAGVQRLDSAGVVQENALVSDAGGILSLNWQQGVTAATHFIRVQGQACGLACSGFDRYRARLYDTTYTVPRYNNSGTQVTVLLVQNATDRTCTVTVHFMSTEGFLSPDASSTHTVAPAGLVVLPTASVVPDLSGSIRVAHTCGYGGLSGKAVSLEPATGFTFDTAMSPRPY